MELIDRLYEAALAPELWGEAVRGLADFSGSVEAGMLLFPEGRDPKVISAIFPGVDRARFESVLWRDSRAVLWALGNGHSEFTPFTVRFDQDELDADPAMRQLYDNGIGDVLTSMVQMGNGDQIGFLVGRSRRLGAYGARTTSALNALRPHLARSGLMAVRLGIERLRAMVETLERLGMAGAVIAADGRVIAANALLEALDPVIVATAFGGIAIGDVERNAQLQAILARGGEGNSGPVASIPIPASDAHPPMVAHLLPVRGAARDIFTGGHVLMAVSRIERRAAASAALLAGLFGLTTAEARLAGELVAGGTLSTVAARLELSVHTVRAQLQSIMDKTGEHRRAELVQLLSWTRMNGDPC